MQCHYCGKTFTSAAWFAKHSCKNKEAVERIGEDRLLAVYELFNFWFRYNGIKRKNEGKSLEGFLKSPYLPYFVDMTVGIMSVYIADPTDYVMWLSDNQIPSKKWALDATLTQYKKIQNKRGTGMERAIKSLELMTMFCDQKDIEIAAFFDTISIAESLRWIESGRLSPWVFLNTSRSADMFDRMKPKDLDRLSSAIDIEYWNRHFKTNSKDVQDIKDLMVELGFEDED